MVDDGKKERFTKKASAMLSESIAKAMEMSDGGKREIYFTFDPKTQELTSELIEGNNDSVVAINKTSPKGGSFHTHPPSGHCFPSARDIYDDFINNERTKTMVGCPAEGQIFEIENLKIPRDMKPFTDLLVSEGTIEKYKTSVGSLEEMKTALIEKLPDEKEEIEATFEQIKDKLLSEDEYVLTYENIDDQYQKFLESIKKSSRIKPYKGGKKNGL